MCIPSHKETVHVQRKNLIIDLIFRKNKAHPWDHDTMPHQFKPKNKFRWAGHRISDLVCLSSANKSSKNLPPRTNRSQKQFGCMSRCQNLAIPGEEETRIYW